MLVNLRERLTTMVGKRNLVAGPWISEWASIVWVALAEVLVVVVIGVLPFLIAVLRYNVLAAEAANDRARQFDFETVFADSFSGGQLYLYAFSLLGTLMWLGVVNWTVPRRTLRPLFALAVVIIGFVLASLGGIDPTFSTIRNRVVVDWSYYLFGASVVIYFLLLVITKERPPSAAKTLSGGANTLMQKYHDIPGPGQ